MIMPRARGSTAPRRATPGGDFDFDFDFGRPGGRGLFARDFPTEAPSLVELMGMNCEEWDVWTRGSAIRRAGY
jgi:hypothetical protein